MWACVIWTDECSFSAEGFGKPYVTRVPEEKYLDAWREESASVLKFV
jgi:hypothetical protein